MSGRTRASVSGRGVNAGGRARDIVSGRTIIGGGSTGRGSAGFGVTTVSTRTMVSWRSGTIELVAGAEEVAGGP